jgi:adenylyltransferase/sulfurtransferase
MDGGQDVPGYVDITPEELARRLEAGQAPRLLDIREQWEWDLVRLPAAEFAPLSQLHDWAPGLDRDQELVLYCHTGRRSAMACQYLASVQGFRRLLNLAGGINAWALAVDPGMRRY